jgi:hypothetical protein
MSPIAGTDHNLDARNGDAEVSGNTVSFHVSGNTVSLFQGQAG